MSGLGVPLGKKVMVGGLEYIVRTWPVDAEGMVELENVTTHGVFEVPRSEVTYYRVECPGCGHVFPWKPGDAGDAD